MRFASPDDRPLVEAICNDPLLRVWSAYEGAPQIDATKYLAAPSFVVLEGDRGCFLADSHGAGRYCIHTNLLPECRGSEAMRVCRAALFMAFVQTDATELVTMVPHSNPQADYMARFMGFKPVFKRERCWPGPTGMERMTFYSLPLDTWITNGACEASGKWFHDCVPHEHEHDPVHDQYVGAAVEMVRHAKIAKGINTYNRWARFAGYRPVRVLEGSPLRLDIGDKVLRIEEGEIHVEAL